MERVEAKSSLMLPLAEVEGKEPSILCWFSFILLYKKYITFNWTIAITINAHLKKQYTKYNKISDANLKKEECQWYLQFSKQYGYPNLIPSPIITRVNDNKAETS